MVFFEKTKLGAVPSSFSCTLAWRKYGAGAEYNGLYNQH